MGRPIESVFIIDNSPHAYSLQPENAFPCTSWFDDYEDNELLGTEFCAFILHSTKTVRIHSNITETR